MTLECNENTGDALIDEVRQRRRDLLAAYDNDLEKLFAAMQEVQSQHPEKLVDRRRSVARTVGSSEARPTST